MSCCTTYIIQSDTDGCGATSTVITVTADYTALLCDDIIIIDPPSGGTVTVTLRSNPETGESVIIKNKDIDGTMSVFVNGGGLLIDGVSTMPFSLPYQSFDFTYDGSEWVIT